MILIIWYILYNLMTFPPLGYWIQCCMITAPLTFKHFRPYTSPSYSDSACTMEGSALEPSWNSCRVNLPSAFWNGDTGEENAMELQLYCRSGYFYSILPAGGKSVSQTNPEWSTRACSTRLGWSSSVHLDGQLSSLCPYKWLSAAAVLWSQSYWLILAPGIELTNTPKLVLSHLSLRRGRGGPEWADWALALGCGGEDKSVVFIDRRQC